MSHSTTSAPLKGNRHITLLDAIVIGSSLCNGVHTIANFFREKTYYPLACEKRSKSGIPTSVSVEISIGIHNYPPFSAFSCLVRIITEQRWVQRWYRKQQGFADAEGVQKVAQKWYQKKASASF